MRRNDVILILAIVIIALLIYTRYNEKVDTYPQDSTFQQLRIDPEGEREDSADARHKLGDEVYASRRNSITRAVDKIERAVVSVNVIKTRLVRRRTSFFFGFYDEVPYNIKSIGSGVIFSEEGYILTNAHVVEEATEIKVILTDNRQLDAELIGIDSVHDIAIIKVNETDLPHAKLGNSHDLIIGEWAIAVGNPYGFLIKDSKPSVSVGVISAVNRDFAENKDGKVYRRMIQTDTAINQGNSGGPLVNILGEVIGINTFIFSENGGSIGIGFSIPIDRVKKVAEELIKYGRIRDIWFGFKVQDITPMLASHFNLESLDGVMVNLVENGSPAFQAGLRKQDVITEINGIVVNNTEDAELAVTDVAVGDKMILTIKRNKEVRKLELDAVEYK